MDSFDPYQDWLGIPSQLRPLNHYVLLGIELFEDDPRAIQAAYESRLKLLKKFQAGPRGELSQQLMTQVAKARIELLNETKKTHYDQHLRNQWDQMEAERDDEPESENDDANTIEAEHPKISAAASQPSPFVDAGEQPLLPSPAEPSERLPAKSSGENSRSLSEAPIEADEGESLIWLLLDIRVLVALLSIVVIGMTATIVLFSDQDPVVEPETVAKLPRSDSPMPADAKPVESDPVNAAAPGSIRTIQQSGNASFDLPLNLGRLTGPELESTAGAIAKWQTGGRAEWRLAVADRRTGYFYCEVTYQAKAESLFSVQLGEQRPRPFTVYPHREDFTEKFFVRLDKQNEQILKLIAKQVESIAEVQIKNIKLVPR